MQTRSSTGRMRSLLANGLSAGEGFRSLAPKGHHANSGDRIGMPSWLELHGAALVFAAAIIAAGVFVIWFFLQPFLRRTPPVNFRNPGIRFEAGVLIFVIMVGAFITCIGASILLGAIVIGPNVEIFPTLPPNPSEILPRDCAAATARHLEIFKQIHPGMSFKDICKIVGWPDGDVGSGMRIFEYKLDDGTIIYLGFSQLDHLTFIRDTEDRIIERSPE